MISPPSPLDPAARVFVHADAVATSQALAAAFLAAAQDAAQRRTLLHVTLPGGETPRLLFATLASPDFREHLPWSVVHLHWGDERCVPPDDPASNFGTTRRWLLAGIPLPPDQVHRLRGEAPDPEREANRYARALRSLLPNGPTGMPRFDWIILGLGADGHTASLFPGDAEGRWSDAGRLCLAAQHPTTGQRRLSLNLPVINAAARVTFFATGAAKAATVASILGQTPDGRSLPAGRVQPTSGRLEWFLDAAAAAFLPPL